MSDPSDEMTSLEEPGGIPRASAPETGGAMVLEGRALREWWALQQQEQAPARVAVEIVDDGDLQRVFLDREPDTQHAVVVDVGVGHPAWPPPSGIVGWVRVESDGESVAGWIASDARWETAQLSIYPEPDEVFARNRGVLESALLKDCTVAIVGLGSGGSAIADELAKAGVGGFVLADRDRLEVENIGRHVCDLSDLGRRKTWAIRDRILRRNPSARVVCFDGDIVARRREVEALLDRCQVVVGATDNNRSRFVLNRWAVDQERVVVFGRAYTRACGGDVMVVRPGGPCYVCLFGEVAVEEEISSSKSGQAPAYADVEVVAEPGLSLDIRPIADMCTRLVLLELVRGRSTRMGELSADLQGALFLWANRRDGQFEDWRPMGYRSDQLAVQRWYGMHTNVDELCPVCHPEAFMAAKIAEVDGKVSLD